MLYCKDCPHAKDDGFIYFCDLSNYSISDKIIETGGYQINCPLTENIKARQCHLNTK